MSTEKAKKTEMQGDGKFFLQSSNVPLTTSDSLSFVYLGDVIFYVL